MQNTEISNEILDRAKAGDMQSFEKILFWYEKTIFNYVFAIVRHRQDAEDLAQEVFLRLYKNIKSFNPEYKFQTWLYTIATNVVRDWFRKKKRQPELFLIDDPDSKFETIDEDFSYNKLETTKDIQDGLNALKPAYRMVLTLFYWQGFGYEEIAGILSLPVNTVKTHISRAKGSLKGILEGESK
jgi:RNA polymerase sigma-70 factor (ECF subfamily)